MTLLVLAASVLAAPIVQADMATDWNIKAGEIGVAANLPPPPVYRMMAMDDALMVVVDAKYHYEFWRPVTAMRNGDLDGSDATERDASWLPLIATPMHPEYPCAHCILAAAVGAVLHAEVGTEPTPTLRTASVTASGTERSWTTIDDFVQEVAHARIYDGVHYRTSTEVGIAMGQKIGARAAAKSPRPLK